MSDFASDLTFFLQKKFRFIQLVFDFFYQKLNSRIFWISWNLDIFFASRFSTFMPWDDSLDWVVPLFAIVKEKVTFSALLSFIVANRGRHQCSRSHGLVELWLNVYDPPQLRKAISVILKVLGSKRAEKNVRPSVKH